MSQQTAERDTPVRDTLAAMTESSLERSGLDPDTLFLVRLAETEVDAIGTSFNNFKVSTNHGPTGAPPYYVCLDLGKDDEHSWWFHPDQAQALGRKLLEYGVLTERQNVEEEERRRRVAPDPSMHVRGAFRGPN